MKARLARTSVYRFQPKMASTMGVASLHVQIVTKRASNSRKVNKKTLIYLFKQWGEGLHVVWGPESQVSGPRTIEINWGFGVM